jgi:hypothetical protein
LGESSKSATKCDCRDRNATEKGEIMMTSNSTDQRVWKRYLQDALLELDAQALREKLKAAHKAIEIRRVELTSSANPDAGELVELTDGLSTLRALEYVEGIPWSG